MGTGSEQAGEASEGVPQSPPNLLVIAAAPWGRDEAQGRAQAFLTGYLELWEAHGALFRVRNLASDEGDERVTAARVHALEPLVARLAAQIKAQQAAGRTPPTLNPNAAAGALLALIERVAAQSGSDANGQSRSGLLRVAAFFLILLLRPDAAMDPHQQAEAHDPALGRRSLDELSASEDGEASARSLGQKGAQTRARLLAAAERELATTPLRDLSVSRIAPSRQRGWASRT